MFYVFSTVTRNGRPILFPSHTTPHTHTLTCTHTYISTNMTAPLCNILPPYAPHPSHPLTYTQCFHSPPQPPPLSPLGCVGLTPGALLSLRGSAERDLTSRRYSKGHSPLYYLLIERSTSMNGKVGSAHNVKRTLLSFLLLLPTCPVSTLHYLPSLIRHKE